MDWVEVPPGEWEAFLGRFTDEHRGWQAAIESLEPGHVPDRLAEGVPLLMITTEPTGSSAGGIAIVAGGMGDVDGSAGQLLHRIARPRHVRFARSGYRTDAAVHIVPAGGPATVLHVWSNSERRH